MAGAAGPSSGPLLTDPALLTRSEVAQSGLSKSQHVIIAGFGRAGQTCARFLKQEEIPFLALDLDPERVSEAKSAGSRWRSAMPAAATSCWPPACCGPGW